jgi:gliding motility-associated-like protein
MTISPSAFTCANIGTNTVTLTATDTSGNVSTGTAIVTIILDNSVTGNNDLDAIPDNCDPDDDNDGILDVNDNCQFIANQNQLNTDNDLLGDICDPDDDNDGVNDGFDNCPLLYNPYQDDRDNDGHGDVCDTIEINVSDAISPNGDGVNDVWVIYNIENHPNNIVRVFNRWGKEVYKARKYQNTWGGEFGTNTETLPEGGSYYYQIDLDGDGTVDKEGWLYISRK